MSWLERLIPGTSPGYRRLVLRVYASVLPCILGRGLPHLFKGLFHALRGDRERKIEEFLDGSMIWGRHVRRITATTLLHLDALEPPPSGHLIVLNHVNELDFAFDCLVLRKPFLANAVIKSTFFAYWWMRAMGSEVFDHREPRTISKSVRALLAGLHRRSYIVYPEGKNSYSEEIGPLRKGMLKLAFEQRIPVYIVLKSGLASFQEQQRGNVIAYSAPGVVDPAAFDDWTAFRDAVHERMVAHKPRLDALVAAAKGRRSDEAGDQAGQ